MLHLNRKVFILALSILSLLIVFFLVIGIRIFIIKNPKPTPLTETQLAIYNNKIENTYPHKTICKTQYQLPDIQLDIKAESAIIIDASNGNILYEKNPDIANPPASMTKLVTIYLALQAVENGKFSLSDKVPIKKEAYAKNAPPSSSLMFLEENQIVTLDELLLGMAVVSGNDAAIAVAQYISGSVEDFVTLMNKTVKEMGLIYTHFVDPSGYSEKNTTTAREFVTFCRIYLTKFPWTLKKYHSVKEFSYPKKNNISSRDLKQTDTFTIQQKATNVVLNYNPYVDGLKTGFIYESGFNMAITAEKNDTRVLAVIMRGPGNTTYEGSQNRIHDCKVITDYVFNNFRSIEMQPIYDIPIPVTRGKTNALFAKEITKKNHTITVPIQTSDEQINITRSITIPYLLESPIKEGMVIGRIEYKYQDRVLETTDLVTDREIKQANKIKRAIDKISRSFLHQ